MGGIMPMPVVVYVGYCIYVVYTGVYLYYRIHGKSAQFFTVRVFPESSDGYKMFSDYCVGGLFVFGTMALIAKTFFPWMF